MAGTQSTTAFPTTIEWDRTCESAWRRASGAVTSHGVNVSTMKERFRKVYLTFFLLHSPSLSLSVVTNEAQESNSLGTGIAIGAAIIVILLVLIGLVVLHKNKSRPVKNTENVQGAERKEDQNAAVMSYSSLEGTTQINGNGRGAYDLTNRATFNTFQPNGRNGNGTTNGSAANGTGNRTNGTGAAGGAAGTLQKNVPLSLASPSSFWNY